MHVFSIIASSRSLVLLIGRLFIDSILQNLNGYYNTSQFLMGQDSKYNLYFSIGEGAYSSVYMVKRVADSDIYALKKVKMVKLSDKEKENALNEVRILASI